MDRKKSLGYAAIPVPKIVMAMAAGSGEICGRKPWLK
jgi:hypothetical protein